MWHLGHAQGGSTEHRRRGLEGVGTDERGLESIGPFTHPRGPRQPGTRCPGVATLQARACSERGCEVGLLGVRHAREDGQVVADERSEPPPLPIGSRLTGEHRGCGGQPVDQGLAGARGRLDDGLRMARQPWWRHRADDADPCCDEEGVRGGRPSSPVSRCCAAVVRAMVMASARLMMCWWSTSESVGAAGLEGPRPPPVVTGAAAHAPPATAVRNSPKPRRSADHDGSRPKSSRRVQSAVTSEGAIVHASRAMRCSSSPPEGSGPRGGMMTQSIAARRSRESWCGCTRVTPSGEVHTSCVKTRPALGSRAEAIASSSGLAYRPQGRRARVGREVRT